MSAVEVISQVLAQQRINCTGLGEVGCRAVEGWHTWQEHERHQAEAIAAALHSIAAEESA